MVAAAGVHDQDLRPLRQRPDRGLEERPLAEREQAGLVGTACLSGGHRGGDEAGTGEVTIEHAAEDGRDLYRQSLVARVAGRAELRSETTFRRRSGTIHAETHEMQTLDGDTPPVAVEQARFRGVKVLQWG